MHLHPITKPINLYEMFYKTYGVQLNDKMVWVFVMVSHLFQKDYLIYSMNIMNYLVYKSFII